ncbi:conserved exported protein of unknown function [Methylocella tundrae]|uniref:Invasion associated locus B family protein n=2 Tax=Methylocella tundrae TaxID=227605 RepID=A0A4U8YUP6_METTU|nr:conserved exported protein of unknown function [Methylocella tundrae]
MKMRRSLIAFAFLPLVWSSAGQAQPPSTQVAQNEAAPKPAPHKKIFGSWTLICATTPGESEESCEADVSLQPEAQLPPVAKVAFVRAAKDKPLRLVAIVQANLTLAPGVEIASDPAKPGVVLPFKSCLNSACLADAELSQDQMQAFRSQTQTGRLTIKNAAGEQLSLSVPSKGLDEALAALLTQ